MKAIELILAERGKQIAKGYTSEHDDTHNEGQLAMAAVNYACTSRNRMYVRSLYPWDANEYFHPDKTGTIDGRIKDLAKAGALIVAEIERLNRLKENESVEA